LINWHNPIGEAGTALIQSFSFGFANSHGSSMGENPKKKQETTKNGWHYKEESKMTIDFKVFFRTENRRQ